jgi:hypothetical protein
LITIQNIIDSINSILVEQYPTCTVYIQKVPEGFKRPSFFIQLITGDSKDCTATLTNENLIFQIVYFAPISDYYIEDELNQISIADIIKKVFKKGYVKVEDRAIKITNFQSTARDEEIYTTLELEYIDDRFDDNDPNNPVNIDNTAPKMNNIIFKSRS